MAVSFTFHGERSTDDDGLPTSFGGQSVDGVAVDDDAVSDPLTAEGVYRIAASTECTMRIGPNLSDASGGEYWPAGHVEYRYLQADDLVAVDAIS